MAFTKPVFKTGALNHSATLPCSCAGIVILSRVTPAGKQNRVVNQPSQPGAGIKKYTEVPLSRLSVSAGSLNRRSATTRSPAEPDALNTANKMSRQRKNGEANGISARHTRLMVTRGTSVAIILQPAARRVIPLYVLFFGVLSLAAYTAFLLYAGRAAKKQAQNVLDTEKVRARPRFWWMAFLEWLVLISTIVWFLVVCSAR